jgi:predicted porin
MYFSQDATVGSVAQTGKTSGTQLGATVPVSAAATLFASYTTGSVTNNSSSLYDTAGMQLVGNYNLSKRTGIYAAYGQTDWKTKNSTVTSSVKYTSYGVGMRHSF